MLADEPVIDARVVCHPHDVGAVRGIWASTSSFSWTLNRTSATQFSEFLLHSNVHEPEPLTADERYQLSWEAGTER